MGMGPPLVHESAKVSLLGGIVKRRCADGGGQSMAGVGGAARHALHDLLLTDYRLRGRRRAVDRGDGEGDYLTGDTCMTQIAIPKPPADNVELVSRATPLTQEEMAGRLAHQLDLYHTYLTDAKVLELLAQTKLRDMMIAEAVLIDKWA